MSVIEISSADFIEVVVLTITMLVMICFCVNIYFGTRRSRVMNLYAVAQWLMICFVLILIYTKVVRTEHGSLVDFIIAVLITAMSYFFVIFAYQYFSEKSLSLKKIILWGLIPLTSVLLLGMNLFVVHLFTPQIIDAINIVVAFLFVVLITRGANYLFRYRSLAKRQFKMRQSIYFSISLFMPVLALVIAFVYMANQATLMLNVILMLISIGIFIWGVVNKMLDEMPSLMNHVIDHMPNGIIIINENLRIIDYNKAVLYYIPTMKEIFGIDDFLEHLYPIASDKNQIKEVEIAVKSQSEGVFIGEIEFLFKDQLKLFNYNISKVRDKRDQVIATMMVIHDVTELQALYQAIEDKNKQLKLANQQVENHVQNINELYVEEERKRLFDDINDTLGHSMTEVLALLEVSLLMLNKGQDQEKMIQVMDDSIERAKLALNEIRVSVKRYKQETEGEL